MVRDCACRLFTASVPSLLNSSVHSHVRHVSNLKENFWTFLPAATKLGQGNILQASVILSTGGCLPQCMLGCQPPPDQADSPLVPEIPPTRQTHPPPPGPGRPPWDQRPPLDQRPPQEADASIRSMSGQYASYWNAFLFGECSDNSVNCNYSSCLGELFFKFLEIISTLTRFYNTSGLCVDTK